MTTREAVTMLKEIHKGWNTDGAHGVLRFLSQAQKILCTARIHAHRVLGSDMQPPTFATTKGNKGPYEPDSSMRTVDAVLVPPCVCRDAFGTMPGEYGWRANKQLALERMVISGLEYAKLPYVNTIAADDTNPARVRFTVDPGTTDTTYRAWGYINPPELTSVQVALTIKSPWDELYLLPAASKLIQAVANGDLVEARQYVAGPVRRAYATEAGRDGYSGDDDGNPYPRGF